MKKHYDKYLRRLFGCVLALALVFTYTVAIYADDGAPAAGDSGETGYAVNVGGEGVYVEPSEAVGPGASDTGVLSGEAEVQAPSAEEGSETTRTVEVVGTAVTVPPEDEGSDTLTTAPDGEQGEQPVQQDLAVNEESQENASTGSVHIGKTSFNPEDEESTGWSDEGKGWKNIGGQYIAMVDYDGKEEISADEGVVTLAVAGVNRIGALKGNCSYQIVGTGIVLIDDIDLEDGNGLTLHPNTALYEEGSAAVFVKQEDESYLLINGNIAGILDEDYTIDDEIELTIPKGASLVLNAMGVRTEYWTPEDSEEAVADVTLYRDTVTRDVYNKNHENGWINYTDCVSRLTIGKNSTLTVDSGATVELMRYYNTIDNYLGDIIEAELVVQGVLNVAGVVEGGCINIQNDGSLAGAGTVKSADVQLQPDGNISKGVTLSDCSLDIYGKEEGSKTVSLTVDNSKIYLHGGNIDIAELNASGSSMVSIDTEGFRNYTYSRIGTITFSDSNGHLDIVANNHEYSYDGNDWSGSFPYRLLEDCCMEIYGKIYNGTVSVLAGCLKYTGDKVSFLPSTQQSVLPVAPEGYASRVFVSGLVNMESNLDPLNISLLEASARAALDEIPLYGCLVYDKLVDIDSGNPLPSREWVVDGSGPILDVNSKPITLSRAKYKDTNIPQLLRDIGAIGEGGGFFSNFYLAVEVINADGSRTISFYDEDYSLNLENAILVRLVTCHWWGGSGGGSATHVSTSFTGSGVLGGPGNGSVKTGTGKVVYGNPKQSEPTPTDPTPGPTPVDPTPGPTPVDPTPEPTPVDPTPEPTPVDPTPVDPTPVDPTPNVDDNNDDPASIDPEKEDINGNENGNESNEKANNNATRKLPGKTVTSTVTDEGLVVSVSLIEPVTDDTTEDILEVVQEMPQIWQLTVTKAGVPVTDLAGTPVNVILPFEVPEDWGDPAELAESDDLYAVFVDEEDELTAYRAQYDPETEVVMFDAEQIGPFVIVKFEYEFTDEELANEEEGFSEEFYKALAELEDIQYFLSVLEEAEQEADAATD